ncbi:hypothetical protein MFUM_60001 [Methylacidiphilum fumariolicum SolV]|uniref:Uncharacterized protein n=2 Tax=Candidatus Methylacidiphilum fumarolicum TaxID=591154 RepID=I0JYI3_METFB|nr:hypothetical protein [Candidatus Methylacidiphilum fumarolicum]CAI9085874.1 conserved protein of unknown function [Candidatus Methylacidiphilum fumarolicum]CCG92302.1 hypothetical protein MFUM_60001 [Methylacidiphilum fumariolicum SolV]
MVIEYGTFYWFRLNVSEIKETKDKERFGSYFVTASDLTISTELD